MRAVDFEYDNIRLSDFGFIMCNFNYSTDVEVADAGVQLTFEKVSKRKGQTFSLINSSYEDSLQTTFDICKNPDEFDDLEITDDEFLEISRWLNRKEFLQVYFIYDDIDKETRYYCGTFTFQKIMISEKLYGLQLTLVTDKPFAYGEKIIYHENISDIAKPFRLYDFSNIIRSFAPNIKIICAESGKLTIKNELLNSTMTYNNCTKGEIITVDGDAETISSSLNAHDIWNDFNYEFLKIGNTFIDRFNTITVSLPCTLEIEYYPIIQDSP